MKMDRSLMKKLLARFRGENTVVNRERIDYMDVSPKQVVSAATACIPFLENDDSNRALNGSEHATSSCSFNAA